MKPILAPVASLALAALLVSANPASAQAVYRCGRGDYSQSPCGVRSVDTGEARAPRSPRVAGAATLRRLPGEDAQAFALRQRRERLRPTDRDECARLDARIAVDQALDSEKYALQREQAREALRASRERQARLRC